MRAIRQNDLQIELGAAASALRAVKAAYRQAILDGDLRTAIDLRQEQLEAEVRLDSARFLIEGPL